MMEPPSGANINRIKPPGFRSDALSYSGCDADPQDINISKNLSYQISIDSKYKHVDTSYKN